MVVDRQNDTDIRSGYNNQTFTSCDCFSKLIPETLTLWPRKPVTRHNILL